MNHQINIDEAIAMEIISNLSEICIRTEPYYGY